MSAKGLAGPWAIEFFETNRGKEAGRCPAAMFLEGIPKQALAKIQAVLNAVAEAPPPSFSGGGMWEAMRGEMSGLYEVRVGYRGMNYRLFCVLVHDSRSIVCLDGLMKPVRSAADSRDYDRVKQLRDECASEARQQ